MAPPPNDHETFRQIMGDLLNPITNEGLDPETLKNLYESKLIYLQKLRSKCFCDMNQKQPPSFTVQDYELILKAIQQTKKHLKDLVLIAMSSSLYRRIT